MEILKTVEVMKPNDWCMVLFALGLISLMALIILFVTAVEGVAVVRYWAMGLCLLGMFISIIGMINLKDIPSGQYTYTISITEPTKYKELIDNGYKISEPLYDNTNIYEITGDPLQ